MQYGPCNKMGFLITRSRRASTPRCRRCTKGHGPKAHKEAGTFLRGALPPPCAAAVRCSAVRSRDCVRRTYLLRRLRSTVYSIYSRGRARQGKYSSCRGIEKVGETRVHHGKSPVNCWRPVNDFLLLPVVLAGKCAGYAVAREESRGLI